MNYLAHIYLSGDNQKLQIGNFIADAVKGSAYNDYPEPIAEGILMHRAIDTYTDEHSSTRELVQLLRPDLGRYSPVLLDIYFDYLLASNFDDFSDVSLNQFTQHFYQNLTANHEHLPKRIKNFIDHFKSTDRLGRYACIEGIRETLEIMVRHRNLQVDVDRAIDFLVDNEGELWNGFSPLFEDLQRECTDYIAESCRFAATE